MPEWQEMASINKRMDALSILIAKSHLLIDYKGFPIEHKPNSCCLTQLHMPDRRKKVKDCGTTNGH
ncbi:hypothetical protein QCD83_21490, partial [Pseudomonas savastanoi pv. phaseolicola]|nr:hypothetical protein [Pseudomonas savastanoi pv. phaseolicola]MDG6391755.1 hypothetical protein [Pseudomonas savastanoi pv. phaseolicola]